MNFGKIQTIFLKQNKKLYKSKSYGFGDPHYRDLVS